MSDSQKPHDIQSPRRQDRLLRELEHDPYHSKHKLKEPTRCPECGAVYHKGHWSRGQAPAGAHEQLCPACQRIHDRVPAAFLHLSGPFFDEHRQEILQLVRHYQQKEEKEHPLKRIMQIAENAGETEITFTDAHLARGIGEAIHHAYQGELDYQYNKGEILLRVRWSR